MCTQWDCLAGFPWMLFWRLVCFSGGSGFDPGLACNDLMFSPVLGSRALQVVRGLEHMAYDRIVLRKRSRLILHMYLIYVL